METRSRSWGHAGVGLFLLIVGLVLLIGKSEILPIDNPWHLWPVIFLAIGIGKLADARYSWEFRKALWWIFLGSWFLVSEFHLFGLSYHNSWPILLIGVGIGMLFKSAYPHSHHHDIKEDYHESQ